MARLDPNEYPLPEPDWRNWNRNTDPQEQAFDKLLDTSKNLPDGQIVGALLRWQRGDGYAWYLVTKERPLTLQWVPYGDAWQVEPALIRGLNAADVTRKIASERRLNALFGQSKNKMRGD